MGGLVACSNDKTGNQSSELRTTESSGVEQAETDAPNAAAAGSAAPQASAPDPNTTGQYRVLAERTYFFDAPRQSTPNGRYLLRGDVLYGEDEANGFVKTRFVNPNGAQVTGWLKAEELGKLTSASAARPSPPPAPRRPPAPTAEVTKSEPAAAPAPASQPTGSAQTAVVQVARSYFYNSPDLVQPRKAHCVKGDKVRLGESRGNAVYVTFTNWENVTSRGWMRKDALGLEASQE
ncbi:hypothetical protein [Hymenobacter koreensis]|uniref:SH3 domain-containing protein n=1 Tax=Hymenobacter koreensis TaxID=1084523 RepID=A0ABP8IYL2_9BACT